MNDFNSNINEYGETRVINTRKDTFIVSIALLIIGTLIMFLSEIKNPNHVHEIFSAYFLGRIIGMLIGAGVFIAVVIFLIFRFKSVNKRANGILIFSILYLLIQINGFFNCISSVIKEKEQERASRLVLTQLVKNFIAGEICSISYSEEEYGVYVSLLTVFANMLNNYLDGKKGLEEKVSGINLELYFDKASLSNKNILSKAKNETLNFKKNIEDYENLYEKFMKDMGESINNLNMPKYNKSLLLKGYYESIESNQDRIKENFKIKKEIYGVYMSIFEFFEELNGKFEIENNNNYLFYNQNEIDRFNELSSKLDELIKKEADWEKDNEEKTKSYLNKLN